ncbi:hypothetical protein [Singulisphaera sp. PoT]|uniref:hypothetical protein n=1 Tax=Singulisphaera sp. PoT TaxID=3411797 RepID=UPI003BF588C4
MPAQDGQIEAVYDAGPRRSRHQRVGNLSAEMRNLDPLISLPAIRALRENGAPAVPMLVATLADGSPVV